MSDLNKRFTFGAPAPKCVVCGKRAYPQESISGVTEVVHSTCFKCQYLSCKVKLTLKNYSAFDGIYYCSKNLS